MNRFCESIKVYRLTRAMNPTIPGETYSYDPAGNRTSSADAATWQYTQNNELATYGATTLTYDQNGNTTEQNASGQITKYTYNTANRLESVLLPGNKTAVYTYDPFGRRVKKQVGTTITYYLYSDEGLIGEYNSRGAFQVGYLYKPNSPWGTNPVLMKSGNAYYYYHNDQLGTPVKMTSDAKGSVVWSATYTSFGKATVTGTVTSNLRFPGQYFDAETGLHYNWHRYYNPATGRYTQTDPIGFGGGDANLYGYVQNNAVNRIDPKGLDVTIIIQRTAYTPNSIGGTINVSSTVTDLTFSGNTLENRRPANPNLPVPPDTYSAFVRTDHTPNRIELNDVPDATNVQIHNGNNISHVKGCFAVGTSASADWVGNSVSAMNSINKIIAADGTGNITVMIFGSGSATSR